MSRAALINDGLFWLVVLSVLLLATFIGAAIRTPPEADAASDGSASETVRPPRPQPQPGRPPPLPKRSVGASGYAPRHATRNRPPWEPAPKPPGLGL